MLVLYWPSLTAPFTFDDYPGIVLNGSIRSVFGHTGSRSLTNATLSWNYAWGRFDPAGYRLFNVGVHIAGALTLFDLARRALLLPRTPAPLRNSAAWIALETALLWAVHPLQTQSVTYVIQRHESLMGLFYLLCAYGLLRGTQSSRSGAWYALSVVAMALGAHCKEPMVTAPFVLLLFDRAYLAGSWREILRSRWDVYLGLLIVSRHFYLQFWQLLTAPPSPKSAVGFDVEGVSSWEYLRTQPQVILHYLRLSIWPDPLCLDYRWPVAQQPGEIALTGAIVLALLAMALVAYWRWPKVGFLALAFFMLLAPTSSFIPIADLAFEHRMYLPLAPLSALVVIGCHAAVARWLPQSWAARTTVAHGVVLAAIIGLGTRTVYRNCDYLDPIVLWRKVLEVAPHNERAPINIKAHLERDW